MGSATVTAMTPTVVTTLNPELGTHAMVEDIPKLIVDWMLHLSAQAQLLLPEGIGCRVLGHQKST